MWELLLTSGSFTYFLFAVTDFISAAVIPFTNLSTPGITLQTFNKFEKQMCGGVYVHLTDRRAFPAVKVGWTMLDVIRNMYPDDFKVSKPWKEDRPCMLEFNTGCGYIKEGKYPLEKQIEIIEKETKEFGKTREKYLLY